MVRKKLPPRVRYRDGRYTYRYEIEVIENGKKRKKYKETRSYKTAEEAYNAGILIRAQLLRGLPVDEANVTFEDWALKWLELYEASGKKPNTVKNALSRLVRPMKWFGGKKLKDIKPLEYQEFLNSLKKEGLSKNTLLGIHSTMCMVFKKAVRPPYELIARDITRNVELPAYVQTVEELEHETERTKYLEKEELALFLRTAWQLANEKVDIKERLIARQSARMLHILAYTGLRIGELCALEKERISREGQYLRISKNLYFAEGIENYKLVTPKNGKPREVDVTGQILKLLSEQELERRQLESMCSNYYSGRNFVFASARRKPGYPVNPRDISEFMKEVLRAAGLPLDLTPHSLRHTFTSLMAEAGVELPAIQRQLGHTNDRITTEIYLHVTKARRRTNVEKLEALMDSIG